MKGKEISSLYRSYSPRMSQYESDGRGRDTYINYNNGGFWTKGVKTAIGPEFNYNVSSKYQCRSLRKHVAPFKYLSDGSGRDSYVIFESGGLKRDHQPLSGYHLKDFLRTPGSCIFKFNKHTNKNGKTVKTHYVSMEEQQSNLQIKNLEKNLINRLYENQKHKFSDNK